MRNLSITLLSLLYLTSFAQTIPLSFTLLNPSSTDLSRPGAGAEQWNGQNTVNLYGGSSATQSRDAYSRFSYTDIQPYFNARGVYSTSYFDMHVHDAIDKGKRFSFAIMPICDFCTGHGNQEVGQSNPGGAYLFYPLWLHNAMQAENPKDWIYNGAWWPNWNSPTWLAAWKEMNTFLNNYIMTASYKGVRYKDIIDYVDVSGYGPTGEWTNIVWHGGGTDATIATLDSIYAYTARVYNNFKVVSQIPIFDGGQLKGNTNIPAAVGWFALTFKNNAGLAGIRRENFGATDTYISWWFTANPTTYVVPNGYPGARTTFRFDSAISNRYKYAPITGEVCCVTNAFANLPSQMASQHVSLIGNGNIYGSNGDLGTIQYNFRAAARAAGYGLQIPSGELQLNGSAMQVKLVWRNSGSSPTYQHWKIEYQLVQGTTIKWTGNSSFDPYLFIAGSDQTITDQFNISSVPAGSGYTLKMFVRDPTGYWPPMPLFITGQNSDGSYNLKTGITINSSSVAPAANAGADQNITLPTNAVTLNGAGSSGSITSYSWTTLSGPNSPNIVSSGSSSTSVTGLIAGTYIFQLALNGGSTDQVTVIVNAAAAVAPPAAPPAVPASTTIFTSQVPLAKTDNDKSPGCCNPTSGQEVGVRFKSSVAGYILGIRFFKTSGNNGIHIGELYSSSGSRLAQATFSSESATGWQTVKFSSPVAIAANTFYIAAYFSSQGYYTEELDYFLHRSLTNGSLTAVEDGTNGASGTDPGNGQGMYAYVGSPSFPNQLYRASNYWVDVVFNTSSAATLAAGGGEKNGLAVDAVTDTVVTAAKSADANPEGIHYFLGQNFPNPSNGNTTIVYQTPSNTKVQIVLRDGMGREIRVLVNENKIPGVYSVDLNTSGIRKGVYYYSMDAIGFHDVKKMLIQ